MKKSLFTILVGLMTCHFSFTQQDVVILKDSSIVKGELISLDLEESIKISTTCCGLVTIAIEKVEKIQFNNGDSEGNISKSDSQETPKELEVDNEKERKKERRKDIFISLIDNTAEVLTAGSGTEPETSDSTVTTGNTQSTDNTGSNAVSNSVGNGCFVNPNFYSRRIKLVHSLTNKRHDISLQPQSEGCLYDLPVGVYEYEVFTTFSNKMITKAQIQITSGKTNKISLSEDNLN